jgi:hypothetical protein
VEYETWWLLTGDLGGGGSLYPPVGPIKDWQAQRPATTGNAARLVSVDLRWRRRELELKAVRPDLDLAQLDELVAREALTLEEK